ncbi:MAG: hypothetical protein H6643_08785 [Caldilineaceae bacterium]|nr:hypothetical protein [Caldilineaceae bacterium]
MMQFDVVAATAEPNESTPPSELAAVAALGTPAVMRRLALIEEFCAHSARGARR